MNLLEWLKSNIKKPIGSVTDWLKELPQQISTKVKGVFDIKEASKPIEIIPHIPEDRLKPKELGDRIVLPATEAGKRIQNKAEIAAIKAGIPAGTSRVDIEDPLETELRLRRERELANINQGMLEKLKQPFAAIGEMFKPRDKVIKPPVVEEKKEVPRAPIIPEFEKPEIRPATLGEIFKPIAEKMEPPKVEVKAPEVIKPVIPTEREEKIEDMATFFKILPGEVLEAGKKLYTLANPQTRDKFITEHPKEAIKFIESYENVVMPFLRKAYPSRIPLAIAEKIVGTEFAATYNEVAERAPVEATIGGLVGDIYNIMGLSVLTGGLSNVVKLPGWAKAFVPYLSQLVPKAIHSGVTWGLKGLLDESVGQFEKGEFIPTKIASETGMNTLFGILLAGAWSIESTGLRILASGAARGSYTTLETYLREGKITSEDLPNIGANTALGLVFAAINANGVTARMRQQRFDDFLTQNTIARMTSGGRMSVEEAKSIVQVMNELGSLQRIPPAIIEQIKVPKGFKFLSIAEQYKIADKIIEAATPAIQGGQPIWSAITKALQSVGFPKIEIPMGLTTKAVLPEEVPEMGGKILEKQINDLLKKTKVNDSVILTTVPTDSLSAKEEEVDLSDPKQRKRVDALKEEILKSGGIKPLLVADSTVQEGTHRLVALQELGIKDAPIYEIQTGDMLQEEAEHIAYNEIIDLYNESKDFFPVEVKPEVKPIPKELEPLAKEAMKYDSAEEFASKSDKIWFHGTRGRFDTLAGDYINLTNNKKAAEIFSASGLATGEQRVLNVIIPEGKTKKLSSALITERMAELDDLDLVIEEQVGIARQEGFEFIHFVDNLDAVGDFEVLVSLNPDKLISLSKSQLTTIYNQAKGIGEVKPTPQAQKGAKGAVLEKKRVILPPPAEKPVTMAKMLKPKEVEVPIRIEKPEVKPVGEEEVERIITLEFEKIKDEGEKQLFRDVRNLGGLKVPRGLEEEMSDIPIDILRTGGFTPDEIISELNGKGYNFESGSDLIDAIREIRTMPSRYKVAKTPLEKNIKIINSYRERMPKKVKDTLGERIKTIEGIAEKYKGIIKPAGLVEKVTKVYAKIEEVKEKVKIGRIIQEKTILNMITNGQEMAARNAFARGQKDGIFGAKEKFKQAVQKAKDRKILRQSLSKMISDLKRIDLSKLRPEYKQEIGDIINNIDFVARRPTTLLKLSKIREFLIENPENVMPDSVMGKLELLDKTRVQDLTIGDIVTITNAVEHLVKLNQLKNKIIFGKQYREAKEIIDQARNNIRRRNIQRREDPTIIDSGIQEPQIGIIKQIFTVNSYNPELITEILDRETHGIIKKVLYGGIDEGVTEQLKYQQEVEDMFKKDLEGINIEKWSKSFQQKDKDVSFQTIKITGNRSIRLTKAERIAFYLHSKNKKNLNHILNGGFRFESNIAKKYRIEEEDLDLIIKSMTPREKKVAEVIHRYFNTWQKGKINERWVELNGFEKAVEPDYYPIRTSELDRKRDALKLQKNFTQATLEGMGIFKERTNAKNALIIEDVFKTVYSNLKKTSAYYGLAKPLRNAKMILQDGKFEEEVIRNYGKPYYNDLSKYIEVIENDSHNIENVEKLTTDLINKLDIAILGLNPFVVFKQPVSYLAAASEIDMKYLKRALPTKVDYKEIKKWSPQLRERLEGKITRELGELGQVGAVRKFFTGKSPSIQVVMKGISKFDYGTIGRIWNAVKSEVRNTHPTLKGDDYMRQVAKRAEEVIRLTQPTWHTKDRSDIGRSQNVFIRLLTKYTSQRNKNYNILRRAVLRYDISKHTNKDKSKLFSIFFTILVVSSLMIEAINEMRRKLYGSESRSIFEVAIATIGNSLSYVYFVGDAFSSLASKVQRGTYGGWDTGNIVSSFIDEAIDGMADGVRAIEQVISGERYKTGEKRGQEKWKTSALNSLEGIGYTIARLRGLPAPTVLKILKGIWKMTGEQIKKATPPTQKGIIERPPSIFEKGELNITRPPSNIERTMNDMFGR